jgi:hypothetical protein
MKWVAREDCPGILGNGAVWLAQVRTFVDVGAPGSGLMEYIIRIHTSTRAHSYTRASLKSRTRKHKDVPKRAYIRITTVVNQPVRRYPIHLTLAQSSDDIRAFTLETSNLYHAYNRRRY